MPLTRALQLFPGLSLQKAPGWRLSEPRAKPSPTDTPEVLFINSSLPLWTFCKGAAPHLSPLPALHSLLAEAVTSYPTDVGRRGPHPSVPLPCSTAFLPPISGRPLSSPTPHLRLETHPFLVPPGPLPPQHPQSRPSLIRSPHKHVLSPS